MALREAHVANKRSRVHRGAESRMNDQRHFGFPACRRDACSCGDQPCPDPAECTATGIETAILACAVVVTIALLALALALPMMTT
jgi:hypothetical protein